LCDTRGVRCIIKRKGSRGHDLPLWPSPAAMGGTMVAEMGKNKKRFFIEKSDTGRVYAFTIDSCVQGARKMYQIEAEYRGRLSKFAQNPGDEHEIISDLSTISKMILTTFLTIQPTILSKSEWIGE